MISATAVLQALRDWATRLSDLSHVDGVYVFGSLVYEGGRLFGTTSDIDLLIRLASTAVSPESRVEACEALLPHLKELEHQAANLIGRTEDPTSIVSAVVVSDFEIRTGIHKDKKWTLFHDSAFLRLDASPALPRPLGPEPDLARLMTYEQLWSALTGAQECRGLFLRFSEAAGRIAKPWDDSVLALPKPLCRAAAQVFSVLESVDGETQVDVGSGLLYITDLLRAAPDRSRRRRLLDNLTPRLGTKGHRQPISAENVLLLWETLFDAAHEAFAKGRDRNTWIHRDTSALASQSVVHALSRAGNFSLLAVDNGIVLYQPPSSLPIPSTIPIDVPSDLSQSSTSTLSDPDEDQLKATIVGMNDDVEGYLSARASGGAQGKFECKVGLRRILLPVERVDQPLRLSVAPLSYWIIREFNRRMLAKNDPTLSMLREHAVSRILLPGETIDIPCPSALYVEVVLLTADGMCVVLEKNPRLSALARTSRGRWTCTLEEGLVWNRDVKEGMLDLASAVSAGLKAELQVFPSELAGIKLLGIALEHTHLNTGVLGFAELRLSAEALRPRIAQSPDFGLGCDFVPINDVQRRYFGDPATASRLEWHPTARLRQLLALRALGAWKQAT